MNPFERYREIISQQIMVDGKDVKSKIEIRTDPLYEEHAFYSTLISEERANKPEPLVTIEKHVNDAKECIFCKPRLYEATPEPRIVHGKLISLRDDKGEIITVPNKYSFSAPHYVTIFSAHKPNLEELTTADMVCYLESAHDLGTLMVQMPHVIGMWDIINWGELAAASQPHPHAQRGGISRNMRCRSIKEAEAIEKIALSRGIDPFDEYIKRVRESECFVFENEFIQISAPFAPQYPDQVDIICKSRYNTLLDINDENVRKIIAGSMLGAFHALRLRRNVTDMNVVTHQEIFNKKSFYRLHWHLFPRKPMHRLGALEAGQDLFVTPIYPSVTADALRTHYKH